MRLTHMAMVTPNNRRLARFYDTVFGMKEVWNPDQNPTESGVHAFYIGDGHFQINCLGMQGLIGRLPAPPKVEINHVGFEVKDCEEVRAKLMRLFPTAKFQPSTPDGRYEDFRFFDIDGNLVEISARGWAAGQRHGLPMIRHVGVESSDPGRLAEFYVELFGMKELRRKQTSDSTAVYLSDGIVNLAIVKNPPVAKRGIQVVGFAVDGIAEISERLKRSAEFLLPDEAPIRIETRDADGPYKRHFLRDPDGNCVDLSEEGWEI